MNSRTTTGRIAALLGVAALVALLAGCAGAGRYGAGESGAGGSSPGGSRSGGSGDSSDLTGSWRLVTGTDAKGEFTPGSAKVTFTFNGASSGGHGPCNSFGATVKGSTKGVISIQVGIHTNIACSEPELNSTEARYFAALNAATTAAISDGKLTLSGGGDTLVFTRGST